VTTDRLRLRDECIASLYRFFGSLTRADSPYWLSLDLTMGQLKAMMALIAQGPASLGALASALGIGEPSASLLVDRLVDHGMVTREPDPDDRRRVLLKPTAEATEQFDRLRHMRSERVAEWLDRLTVDELRQLTEGLAAVVRAGEQDGAAQMLVEARASGSSAPMDLAGERPVTEGSQR
jgi:DNA-binding MarR family transcriptional regulator